MPPLKHARPKTVAREDLPEVRQVIARINELLGPTTPAATRARVIREVLPELLRVIARLHPK